MVGRRDWTRENYYYVPWGLILVVIVIVLLVGRY